ncbi:MAG TPA: hypothetical protein VF984_03060 [Actinomycetota bacterium]
MKSARFGVEIETWGPSPGAEEALADLAEALAALGVDGAVTSVGGLAGGVGATFGVDSSRSRGSDPMTAAVRQGIDAFEGTCRQVGVSHGDIARVDVMTDLYLDRWLAQEPERYAGVSEVAALFGVSRQRVAELRGKRGFPSPVAELSAGPVWKVSSLNRFLEEWDRKPGRPRRARSA